MSLVYLSESGIQLWEAVSTLDAGAFTTLTLLGNSVEDVTPVWQKLVAHVRAELPGALKWRTIGHSLAQWRTQESRALALIAQSLGPNDIVRKSSETGIVSSIQDVSAKLHELDLSLLAQPTHSALIFLPSVRQDAKESVMSSLSRADQGLTAVKILEFLQAHTDLVLCRTIESGTHFAVQFVGADQAMEQLSREVEMLNVLRIRKKDVAGFING